MSPKNERRSLLNIDQERVMETQVRKAVRKAFAQLFKDIANQPTLIIELPESEDTVATRSLNDILEWLFRQGGNHGSSDNTVN